MSPCKVAVHGQFGFKLMQYCVDMLYWESPIHPGVELNAQSCAFAHYVESVMDITWTLHEWVRLLHYKTIFVTVFSCKFCVGNCLLFKAVLLNPLGARGTLKKATELIAVPLPVHNKLNIKLNTSICLSFTYITRKSQRLTSNWSITDRFARHIGSCLGQAVLTDLTTESGSFWIEAATDCLLSMTEWLVPKVATRILIHTYKFRTSNKTLPPLRIFVFRNPCNPFSEPC
jgi:ribosomal protein L33